MTILSTPFPKSSDNETDLFSFIKMKIAIASLQKKIKKLEDRIEALERLTNTLAQMPKQKPYPFNPTPVWVTKTAVTAQEWEH